MPHLQKIEWKKLGLFRDLICLVTRENMLLKFCFIYIKSFFANGTLILIQRHFFLAVFLQLFGFFWSRSILFIFVWLFDFISFPFWGDCLFKNLLSGQIVSIWKMCGQIVTIWKKVVNRLWLFEKMYWVLASKIS